MGFEEPSQAQNIEREKKSKWEKALKKLDKYGKTGREEEDVPFDDGIKEAVVALNLLDIPTTSSCAGHTYWKYRISCITRHF